MTFYSEITLPESGEVCKVNQLSFLDYFTLNKFLQNNIDEHIEDAFFNLLKKYTNKKGFTALDGIVALLFMRIISIGPTLKLVSEKIDYIHDISPLLQKLCDIIPNPIQIPVSDSISLNLKTPSKFYNISFDSYIYSATVEGKEHILTTEERILLYSQLPIKSASSIEAYSNCIEEEIKKITFKIIKTDVVCGIVDHTLFELLKLLYKDSILGCQRRLISIVNYTGLNADYVNSIPPAEVEMLISFIEEQESKQKSPTAPNIPLGAPSRGIP